MVQMQSRTVERRMQVHKFNDSARNSRELGMLDGCMHLILQSLVLYYLHAQIFSMLLVVLLLVHIKSNQMYPACHSTCSYYYYDYYDDSSY